MAGSKRERIYLVLIGLTVIAILCAVVTGAIDRKTPSTPPAVPEKTASAAPSGPRVVEVEKMIEVEKEITAQVLQDGLRDMGILLTGEYYFTEVVQYSSVKTLFRAELPFTESSYLASYDGVVTAGLDFSKIKVEKDDSAHTILLHLPKAELRNVDIDTESFTLISEKTGLGNPISITDFNQSLMELENNAKTKALERGLLEKADNSARTVISNFISSLVDTTRYTVRFAEV